MRQNIKPIRDDRFDYLRRDVVDFEHSAGHVAIALILFLHSRRRRRSAKFGRAIALRISDVGRDSHRTKDRNADVMRAHLARENFRERRNGGIGAFTPDNVPIFDWVAPNVYMIADSNHGFKMIGVGELVAGELLGEKSALLTPFRFSRYAEGTLHPVSNSPFPWS